MQDILTNTENDLQIKDGNFVVGISNSQQQKHIITASKGEYKEFPEVGVGIVQMLADDRYTEMLIETKKQLEYDGMQIKDVSLQPNGNLMIDGKYKE
ncbi:oxidase [Ornithobacterium rhinotracheale]|uniref:oxidase n=1 Tax=Ornithobacterium rhinotracheale TaxID=28251 RepID=UPI00129D0311|nr:oxidase [Ornithobacterium rhinotracheale]MRI64535.1 oxidase [Ornithobacterium rhinotracheale]MRJ11500.1 oxidase [Ornithobacterium rhinotracheale]